MDSNTYSTPPPVALEPPGSPEWLGSLGSLEGLEGARPPEPEQSEWPELPEGLAGLAAGLDKLAAQNLDRLSGSARVRRIRGLRWLVDRLEGLWFKELAALDALGAAATDPPSPAPSTASWLRRRLRMGAGPAHEAVRTARALFRGPSPAPPTPLSSGQLSPAHARVLANGTRQLPVHTVREAEPVLLEAARRLDLPLLRQAVGYLVEVADP